MRVGDIATVTVDGREFSVRKTYESAAKEQFLVGGADKHATPATVRVGNVPPSAGKYACLSPSHLGRTDCEHCRAARLADEATHRAVAREREAQAPITHSGETTP